MTTKHMGMDQYCWFIGRVEDREDPLKLGRLRVRIFNYYSESKAVLPTENLPWAMPITPIISASSEQVGLSPTGPVVGTVVTGFFADGTEAQMPIIIGTLPGIPDNEVSRHDVPQRARETSGLEKEPLGPEPEDPYQAKYPFNKVFQSESGHVIEVDDTPGKERIHVYHKSGTYSEINNEGRFVHKIVKDGYEVIAGDKHVYVQGDCNVEVVGNVNVQVHGNVDIQVDGTFNCESKGNMTFTAPRIDLNP